MAKKEVKEAFTAPKFEGSSNDNLEAKMKALEAVRLNCDKKFGTNSLIKMDGTDFKRVPLDSTDIIGLDDIMGGGMGQGRIIEIYGPESSGKTTIALHAIAAEQARGNIAAFIDAEHALDPIYAQALGVKMETLYLSQPDCGEQALEIAEELVESGAVSIIVIDSVAALTPRAEIEGEMGDSHMGLQARLMSQALRKLTGKLSKTKTKLIFINQLRMKIGVMFGNPETTTGGNALKFYASQRLDVRKIETMENSDDEATANKIRVKCIKNKLAPPFRKREFELEFGKGINKEKDLLSLAVEKEVVDKAGAWYSYKEEKIGQGMENASKWFATASPELRKEIEDAVREKLINK